MFFVLGKESESQKHYKFSALQPRICKLFSRFTFFSSHKNNFFSQYVRTIMVTKYHFSRQFFSAVATMFSFFFPHKKLKKPPSKVTHNRPIPFISQSSPAHSPELIFHIIKCWEQVSVLLSVILTNY